ncbi:MAG: hypothetical protein FWD53_08895, partial [Phycisphaerales bacterium]|nr:hypothetical protein [Phycisphaerales bacterium]
LYGRVLGKEWVWTRYAKRGQDNLDNVYPLKAGEQTLTIKLPKGGRPNYQFHLNKLIITNDQSFVPEGKLGIF